LARNNSQYSLQPKDGLKNVDINISLDKNDALISNRNRHAISKEPSVGSLANKENSDRNRERK